MKRLGEVGKRRGAALLNAIALSYIEIRCLHTRDPRVVLVQPLSRRKKRRDRKGVPRVVSRRAIDGAGAGACSRAEARAGSPPRARVVTHPSARSPPRRARRVPTARTRAELGWTRPMMDPPCRRSRRQPPQPIAPPRHPRRRQTPTRGWTSTSTRGRRCRAPSTSTTAWSAVESFAARVVLGEACVSSLAAGRDGTRGGVPWSGREPGRHAHRDAPDANQGDRAGRRTNVEVHLFTDRRSPDGRGRRRAARTTPTATLGCERGSANRTSRTDDAVDATRIEQHGVEVRHERSVSASIQRALRPLFSSDRKHRHTQGAQDKACTSAVLQRVVQCGRVHPLAPSATR